MMDALHAEIEDLRRDILACLFQPGGGEDLGFQLGDGGWLHEDAGGSVCIEQAWHEAPNLFVRGSWRNGKRLAPDTFHPTARSAMRAKP